MGQGEAPAKGVRSKTGPPSKVRPVKHASDGEGPYFVWTRRREFWREGRMLIRGMVEGARIARQAEEGNDKFQNIDPP